MIKYLSTIAFLYLLKYLIKVKSDGVISKLGEIENVMLRLRSIFEKSWAKRCNFIKNQKTCVYHACAENEIDTTLLCDSKFTKTTCNRCSTKVGMLLNKNFLFAKLADKYGTNTDPNDALTRENTISAIDLFPEMISIAKTSDLIKWIYYGSNQGGHYTYPGSIRCEEYDNRLRPWYVGAASGSKNLLFVVDISGSMINNGKWDAVKKTVSIILDTLTSNDYIGLIVFNHEAKNPISSIFSSCSDHDKKHLLNSLDKITPNLNTNYYNVFNAINKFFKDSYQAKSSLACEDVIVFLTDGEPTEGIRDPKLLIKSIDSKFTHIKDAKIFMYSYGNNASLKTLRAISCHFNGFYDNIFQNEYDDIVKRLKPMLKILSIGIEIIKPIWIEPYIDSSGLGQMTTCALPIYDIYNRSFPILLGVLGIDILTNDLIKYETLDNIKVLLKDKSNQRSCNTTKISQCEMEHFRPEDIRCGAKYHKNVTCHKIKTKPDKCNIWTTLADPFCNVVKNVNYSDCCGFDFCFNIGVIIGPIIGIVLMSSLIILIVKCLFHHGIIKRHRDNILDQVNIKKKDDDDNSDSEDKKPEKILLNHDNLVKNRQLTKVKFNHGNGNPVENGNAIKIEDNKNNNKA